MKKGIVVIVGRPNVGKSTLFNRLCRKRSAIIDFEEGITRDRKYEEVEWTSKNFMLVDTGGIIHKPSDSISKSVRFQTEIAIMEADLILFMIDAKVGITSLDLEIGRLLLPHHDKILLVANKADNLEDEYYIYDYLSLGFGTPVPISASQGRNIGDLLDDITDRIVTVEDYEAPDEIKVAVVGKPNVGKSSFVNRLVGENTVIVDKEPGTTRDSTDSLVRYHNHALRLIDTAGLRKKKSVTYGVEYFSSMRTIDSIDRCDVAVLLISAEEGITDQDQKIASYISRKYKNIIIAVNKWDLIEKDNATVKEFTKKIREELVFIDYAPIVYMSVKNNLRVRKVYEAILAIDAESKKRIPTSELNEFLKKILTKNPPSHSSGKHTKIFYCTQQSVQPPLFIFFCNNATLVTKNYRKYLYNQLRDHYKFVGITIKMAFRSRGEKDSSE